MDTNPLEVALHCGGFCANFPSDVNGEEDHIKGNTSAESDSSMGKDAKCGKRVYQKQKAGLHVDVIQSPPLCRMYFSQYQASSALLE